MRPSEALRQHRADIRRMELLLGVKTDVLTPMALHERFRQEVLRETAPV